MPKRRKIKARDAAPPARLDTTGGPGSYSRMVAEREYYFQKGYMPRDEAELDRWERSSRTR